MTIEFEQGGVLTGNRRDAYEKAKQVINIIYDGLHSEDIVRFARSNLNVIGVGESNERIVALKINRKIISFLARKIGFSGDEIENEINYGKEFHKLCKQWGFDYSFKGKRSEM